MQTNPPNNDKKPSLQSRLMWPVAIGVFFACVLALSAFSSRIQFSHKKAYDKIYIGMPKKEAVKILLAQPIECGLTEPSESAHVCRFNDAWHLYLISVDPTTERVARKDMLSRGPIGLQDLLHKAHNR